MEYTNELVTMIAGGLLPPILDLMNLYIGSREWPDAVKGKVKTLIANGVALGVGALITVILGDGMWVQNMAVVAAIMGVSYQTHWKHTETHDKIAGDHGM